MATKKFLELQDLSVDDLKGILTEREAEYSNKKFEHAMDGLQNPLELRESRRDVARIKTELSRREMAEASDEFLAGRSKIRRRRRKK